MGWFNKSLQARLLSVVIGSCLLLLIVAVAGMTTLANRLEQATALNDKIGQSDLKILEMNYLFKEQVQEWKNTLIRGTNPEKRDKYWGRFHDRQADIQNIGKALLPSIKQPEAKAKIEEFLKIIEYRHNNYRKFI